MKTKIHFGLIALAMLAMSSCTKEVTVDQVNPDTPIEFGTYLGRAAQTKGSIATLDAATVGLQTTGFGVYAFYTGTTAYEAFQTNDKAPDFMANEKLTYSNGWTYSPVKYWPNNTNDKLSFFAYAPYYDGNTATSNITAVSAKDTKGDPTLTFVVADEGGNTVSNQVDLLYACLPDQTKPNVGTQTTFNFQHALSRIGFKAQAVVDAVNKDDQIETDGNTPDNDKTIGSLADGTTITVNSITLSGPFQKSGVLDLTTGNFSANDNTSTVKYSPSLESNATTVTSAISNELNAKTDYMMLIPGTFENVTVTVNYTVTTTDSKLDGGSSAITNIIESKPFKITLAKGKAYTFILHLGMKSVELSATVTDWGTDTTIVANVPLNS